MIHYPNLQRRSYKLVAAVISLSLVLSAILLLFPFNAKSMVPNDLPAPWQNNDVGLVGIPGSAAYNSGTFTVNGSGSGISGTSDAFHYVYQTLASNGSATARVNLPTNTSPNAIGGVMIRNSLAANTPHITVGRRPNGTVWTLYRSTTNGGTTTINHGNIGSWSLWLRIIRSGDTFTTYYSTNGTSWNLLQSVNLTLNTQIYAGLAVSSANNGVLATDTFSNVLVDSWGSGIPTPTNTPTLRPTNTPTSTNTPTHSPTPTHTPTNTATPTNTPTATNTPVPIPSLEISKSGPSSAAPGSMITYTLALTNSGSLTATNVIVTDTLPIGASYVGGGTLSGDVISWQIPQLGVNNSEQVSFVVTATTTITNYQYGVYSQEVPAVTLGQVAVVTHIFNNPVADFTAWPWYGTAPLTVTFSNDSIDADTFLWDFGDGTISIEISPTHTYTMHGTYTVTLTANNLNGSHTLVRPSYIIVDPGEIPHIRLLPMHSVVFETVGESFQYSAEVVYPEDWNGPIVPIEPDMFVWTSANPAEVQITEEGLATAVTTDAYAFIIATLADPPPDFPYEPGQGAVMVADIVDTVVIFPVDLVNDYTLVGPVNERQIIAEVVLDAQTSTLAVGDTAVFGDILGIIIEEIHQVSSTQLVLVGITPSVTDIYNDLHVDVGPDQFMILNQLKEKGTESNNSVPIIPSSIFKHINGPECIVELILGLEQVGEERLVDFKYDVTDQRVTGMGLYLLGNFTLDSPSRDFSTNVECTLELPPFYFLHLAGLSNGFQIPPFSMHPSLDMALGVEVEVDLPSGALVNTPALSASKTYSASLLYEENEGYSLPTNSGPQDTTVDFNLFSFQQTSSDITIDGHVYAQVGLDWNLVLGPLGADEFTLATAKTFTFRYTAGREYALPPQAFLTPSHPNYQGPTINDYLYLDFWGLKEIGPGDFWNKLQIPLPTVDLAPQITWLDEEYYYPTANKPLVNENPVYINGEASQGYPATTHIQSELTPWDHPFWPNPVSHTETWLRDLNADPFVFEYQWSGNDVTWTPQPGEAGEYEVRTLVYYGYFGDYSLDFPSVSPIAETTVLEFLDLMVSPHKIAAEIPVNENGTTTIYVTNTSDDTIVYSFANLPPELAIYPAGTQTITPGATQSFLLTYSCGPLTSTNNGQLTFDVDSTVSWEGSAYTFNCVNFNISPARLTLYGNANGGLAAGSFTIHNVTDQTLTWAASSADLLLDPEQNSVGIPPGGYQDVVVAAYCPAFGTHTYIVTLEGSIGNDTYTRFYEVRLLCNHRGENGMYLYDIGHSGYKPFESNLNPPFTQSFYYEPPAGFSINSLVAPVASDHYLFVPYNHEDTYNYSRLEAYHKESGVLAWSTVLSGAVGHQSNPVVVDDILYIVLKSFDDQSAWLHALDANSGALLWSNTLASIPLASVTPTVDFGKVYVVTLVGTDVNIYAFDKDNGETEWYRTYNNSFYAFYSSNPILVDNSLVFYIYYGIGSNEGELIAVDKDTGNIQWANTNLHLGTYPFNLVGDPINNHVYTLVKVAQEPMPGIASVRAYNVHSGEMVWADTFTAQGINNLVLEYNKLYNVYRAFDSENRYLKVYDVLNGTVSLETQIPTYMYNYLNVANGVLYGVAKQTSNQMNNIVIALDTTNGNTLWQSGDTGFGGTASIVISDGKLYTHDGNGLVVYENGYSISGQVTNQGSGMSGIEVEVLRSDGHFTVVTTDTNGYYTVTDLTAGEYTVTPIPTDNTYGFLPESLSFILSSDMTDVDFEVDVWNLLPHAVGDDVTERFMVLGQPQPM